MLKQIVTFGIEQLHISYDFGFDQLYKDLQSRTVYESSCLLQSLFIAVSSFVVVVVVVVVSFLICTLIA